MALLGVSGGGRGPAHRLLTATGGLDRTVDLAYSVDPAWRGFFSR